MSYVNELNPKNKIKLLKQINLVLLTNYHIKHINIVYDVITKKFAKEIKKDFKNTKISISKVLNNNFYALNRVNNYGKLSDYPASLVHFK